MRKYLAVLGIVGLSFASAPLLTASSVSAAQFKSGDKCSSNFLGLPTWYRGLDREGCNIVMPSSGRDGQNLQDFIFIIILNVIDIVLRIIGYAAVGFVIYGGFKISHECWFGRPYSCRKENNSECPDRFGYIVLLCGDR
jgi:hypothetical protein